MSISNINVEQMRTRYKDREIQLTFPSVTKQKRPWGSEFWLALWMQDGIPQHCQCGSEEEGWYLIRSRIEDK